MRTVVQGGTVVTAAGAGPADVLVEDERVVAVAATGSELSRVTGRDEVGHVGFYEIGISELDVSVVEGTAKCLDGIMHALC